MAKFHNNIDTSSFGQYSIYYMSDEIIKILNSHGEQIDLIVKKVLEHDERLGRIEENMVTRKDHHEIMGTLDELLKFTKKKDEELTMITHGMRRHEDHFEAIDTDLKRIKPALGLT